jgi:hypothetical protein
MDRKAAARFARCSVVESRCSSDARFLVCESRFCVCTFRKTTSGAERRLDDEDRGVRLQPAEPLCSQRCALACRAQCKRQA